MMNLSVPEIFWGTLFATVATLFIATLIGRTWAELLPYKFKGIARFYLSPVLGLASLTVIASLLGRILPLGDSLVVPLLIFALLFWVLVREQYIKHAFSHAAVVSGFGIVCGASVLGPLFAYGALNAHNDTFTYLAHATWLQEHAFNEIISASTITPLTTQISMYQQEGFRMGGSFLLALIQSLLNLRWSYEVYPALVISAVAASCLAIGFPIAQELRRISRGIRLVLLAFPALSLGGLVFGANLGFLPQTIGLALGASFLFVMGPMLRRVSVINNTWRDIGRMVLPNVVLFSGAVFAYSELAPFLLIAVIGSGFVLALKFHSWKKIAVFIGTLLGLSVIVLNTELLRVVTALQSQSGAVVGSPVDWSLLGYFAHAFGVHGGAWDGFQWTMPENAMSLSFAFGVFLFSLAFLIVVSGRRIILQTTMSGVLMPTIIVLMVFISGILYFRYFVPSPFPNGMGQSWSQFKLADWAHPFVMVLIVLSLAGFRPKLGKVFDGVVVTIFTIGLVIVVLTGVARTAPLMNYYSGVSDLNRFYLDFRNTVLTSCPSSAPIYLALRGQHHKFRQMAILLLPEREVTSNWTDDGYIYARLPVERRDQELTVGSCLVEFLGQDGFLSEGSTVGSYRVGVFDGRGKIGIVSVTGGYGRESDGKNWWHWVENKVSFKLKPLFIPKDAKQTKLSFEYGTRSKQTLVLRIIKHNGSSQKYFLQGESGMHATFEKIIDVAPSELAKLSVETDGKATPLAENDTRLAAWIIRNLNITSASL